MTRSEPTRQPNPPEPAPTRQPPAWSAHLPTGVTRADVDLTEHGTLVGAWTAAWRADPARPTLRTLDGAAMNAGELEHRSAAAARRLLAVGLRPGDRVLISARTSMTLIVTYIGALRAGLAVVPANPDAPIGELTRLIAASRPALAVFDDPDRRRETPAAVRSTAVDLTDLSAGRGDEPIDLVRPDDTALIIYTSGTTGRPKGVPLTHANLLAGSHSVRIAWRWSADDTLALGLPLFHMHGLGVGLHTTLVAGASTILLPRFDPATTAQAIADGATLFFGVPTMFHRLAETAHLNALRQVRLAVSGSAPLPAHLHQAIEAATGQAVLERYGMTETVMLAGNPYDEHRRAGTVGFALPGVDLRLTPHDGGTAEIQVRGPSVVAGYLDNPGANAESYTSDGWFRTGDLGVVDPGGYLRINGRARELIITGGFNVYPREVEEVLRSHPDVLDCAVVGVPSQQWGETVVAYVVGSGTSATTQLAGALDAWCGRELAAYKRPREWRWVDEIPRNALGKIMRHVLRD